MGLDTTRLAVLATSLSLCAVRRRRPTGADYPRCQTVRLIVPYAAGSMTDLVARIVSQKLGEGLGQAVVVENKPGASTITGLDFMAGAPGRTATRCWWPPTPRSPSTLALQEPAL